MRKIKVLQINSVSNTGSTGKITEDIGGIVIKEGGESYIAFGRDCRESRSHKIKIGTRLEILLHVCLTRFFDLHGEGSVCATKGLIKKIEEINPDIIHLHNIHGYYLNIKLLFKFLADFDKPIVWTLHDCWPIMGHGAYFKYKINKKGESYWSAPKSEYPKSWFIDNSFSNYKKKKKIFTLVDNLTLICVSNWLSNIIKTSFLSDYSIKTIHNGVNIDIFIPQKTNIRDKYNIKKDDFIILGVASIWEERKGLKDFFQFAKNLKSGEFILLIGITDEIIKTLPHNMIGIRRTENMQELAELYSTANVYVNLTWEDNFPTTNIEALACGTPVITYDTGGSPEAVSEETGFVIPKGDLKALRKSINIIKKHGKDFYSDACRDRAERLYNKEDRFREYIDLYKQLLNKERL